MTSLDMSLDDMIKSRHNTDRGRGQGRPRGGRGGSFSRGRMTGVPHRGGGPLRVNTTRPSAHTIAKASSKLWMSYEFAREYVTLYKSEHKDILKKFADKRICDILFLEMLTMAQPQEYCCIAVHWYHDLHGTSNRRTKSLPWQRNLLEESLRAVGLPGIENRAKLFVYNLDGGVSNEDIRELFSEIGVLKRYAIHYDKNGQPSGSAEVVFARRSDAFQAMKRYNNVQLDGKPMKIEIVVANSEIPVSASARVNVVGGVNGRRTVMMTPEMGRGLRGRGAAAVNRISGQRSRGGTMNGPGRGNSRGPGRGNSRGRRGRGGGRGAKRNVDKSADQLDKELENYHAEALQT